MPTPEYAKYAEFFYRSKQSVALYDTVEISHPSFGAFYRLVRNAYGGMTAMLETGFPAVFQYVPMSIEPVGSTDDLDYGIRVSIGDVGEILAVELQRLMDSDTFKIKPEVRYRAYRSDDLLGGPLEGPIDMEIKELVHNKEGVEFDAVAQELNETRTGELYRLDRFATLKGFV